MRLRPVLVPLALALVLAGALGPAAGTAAAQDQDYVEPCAAHHGDDFAAPANDSVGWVPGPSAANGTDGDGNLSGSGDPAMEGAGGSATTTTDGTRTDSTDTTAEDGMEPEGGNDTEAESTDGNDTGATNETRDGNDTAVDTRGTWYDEPIRVNDSDGLDGAELNATVARTAARVEALRCRSFETVPSVRVINRSRLESVQVSALYDRSVEARRFDDARLEAALLLSDDRNATEARVATRTAAILAYYDPSTDEIVLVAENRSAPRIDETTLAHELMHALQDQHFDLGRFDSRRIDVGLAETGLIEGDAALVETRYQRRCNDRTWTGGCLSVEAPASDAEGSIGLRLLLYHPYNNGPLFVQEVYGDGGWAAVDDLYADPPTSTRHVFEPETYPEFEREPVRVGRNVTDDRWTRLRPPERPASDVLGPAAIGSALMAPSFEPETENVYPPDAVQHSRRGNRLDVLGPYRYQLDVVRDWEGGQLQVFVDDRNRTATIWRTVWASPEAAETFRDRYVELVQVRDGRGTADYEDTYRFPEASDREGAVYVATEGREVVVVRGPDVEALRGVYGGAAPEDPGGFASSEESSAPSNNPENGTDDEPEDAQPGLGIAAAVLALLAFAAAGVGLRGRRS